MSYQWDDIAISLITAIGIIGNVFVICYFIKINRRNLKRMSSYHFLIILLAFTDLFFSMVTLGTIFHLLIAAAANVIRAGLFSTALLIIILLSFERYRNIVHPFKGKIRKCCFFAIYISVLLVFSSYRFGIDQLVLNEPDYNWLIISFEVVRTLSESIIPLIFMMYFYKGIYKKIKESETLLNSTSAQQQLLKRNKKAVKTVKWLIILYILFVFPAKMLLLIILMEKNELWVIIFFQIFSVLCYFNSSINVFVYLRIIKGFRNFVFNIFTFGLAMKRTTTRTLEMNRL